MSSYKDRFAKIRLVFHAHYFENEVGDPPVFCISDTGKSLPDCSKSMKKFCVVQWNLDLTNLYVTKSSV